MKPNSQLKQLFEDSELEKLRIALVGDNTIMPCIEKIIESKIAELLKPTGVSGISTNWPLKKAHSEGGAYYLQGILNIFKEK
jgi:hypothetical protein